MQVEPSKTRWPVLGHDEQVGEQDLDQEGFDEEPPQELQDHWAQREVRRPHE
jgi:hypothetical protein